MKVRANADVPRDAIKAGELGAEGIGRCRTEHMFFGEEKIKHMRDMILAREDQFIPKALAEHNRKRGTRLTFKELKSVDQSELKNRAQTHTRLAALKESLPLPRKDFISLFPPNA